MTQDTATGLVAGTWSIDPAHSEVSFTVRHLMSKVRGRFTEFSGEIVTTEDPSAAKVEVAISTASITTANEQRDGHLRSTDFFADSSQPMTFVSTGVRADGEEFVISGDLTVNGVTKPVDLATEFLGVEVDAFGATRVGAEATTSISRKDFAVDFNIPLDGGKLLIGDKIDITLAIEAVKSEVSPA